MEPGTEVDGAKARELRRRPPSQSPHAATQGLRHSPPPTLLRELPDQGGTEPQQRAEAGTRGDRLGGLLSLLWANLSTSARPSAELGWRGSGVREDYVENTARAAAKALSTSLAEGPGAATRRN